MSEGGLKIIRHSLLGTITVFVLIVGGIAARCSDESSKQQRTITTWSGEGTQGYDGDGHHRTKSWLNQPMEMSFGQDGQAYIADWNNHRIRRVRSDNTLETVIGSESGLPGDWPCQDPADPGNCEVPLGGTMMGTTLSQNHPTDLVFAPDGTAYLAAWHNHKIYHYDPVTGVVTIVAGQQLPGFGGDGGPARNAKLNFPSSLVMDAVGNLFVSDQRSNRIRRIAADTDRTIRTVVGSSNPPSASGYGGDDGPATAVLLALTAYNEAGGADNPPPGGGLAMDGVGNLYVADTFNHCIRKVSPGTDRIIGDGESNEEIITTVAGRCTVSGYEGDGGPAKGAKFDRPFDLDIGPDGRLYVADTGNHVIRAIHLTTGIVLTVTGTGMPGFSGEGGPATAAQLRGPYGIAFDRSGNLFIVDTLNNRIRIVAK